MLLLVRTPASIFDKPGFEATVEGRAGGRVATTGSMISNER